MKTPSRATEQPPFTFLFLKTSEKADLQYLIYMLQTTTDKWYINHTNACSSPSSSLLQVHEHKTVTLKWSLTLSVLKLKDQSPYKQTWRVGGDIHTQLVSTQ